MPCHLEFTSKSFVFASRSYPDIPLLVDEQHRFVSPVCDYLRHLVTHDHLKTSSVKTYADYLLHYWRFICARDRDFQSLSDKDLIRWLNQQEADGVSRMTQAARCDAVFDLYVWLEANGYVDRMVRIPGFNDGENFTPRLTAVSAKGSIQLRRASRYGISCAVRPRVRGRSHQSTPNSDAITEIYVAADTPLNPGLAERNHLLIDWYVQVGLRRMEWSALTTDQVPTWDVIDGLREAGAAHELRLTTTKGDRPRHVAVLPELLEKTREYVEETRAEIVLRFKKKKGPAYKVPSEVFLSSKTGMAMDLTSISNMLTRWFKSADVKGHGHRLRAAYLTNLFEAELRAEESRITAHPGTKIAIDYELILRKVAERAGHAHLDSLRSYLTLAKKRRARADGATDFVTLQQQLDAKRQELAILNRRLTTQRAELGLKPRRKSASDPGHL